MFKHLLIWIGTKVVLYAVIYYASVYILSNHPSTKAKAK